MGGYWRCKKGLALLDRDRPGHTFIEDMLRVSIARYSTQPFDLCSDSGEINACFRIVPYEGGFEISRIPAMPDEFCHPPLVWQTGIGSRNLAMHAMPVAPFDMEGEGIITSSFKAAENKKGYVLRLYESLGKDTRAVVSLHEKLAG